MTPIYGGTNVSSTISIFIGFRLPFRWYRSFFIRKAHGDKYFPKTPTSGHDKPDDAICEDDSKQNRIHQHIHSPYYDYYTIYLW